MSALVDQNAEYVKVTIMKVDWDRYAKAPIRSELKVVRRSTLIAFKDGKEQTRVVAGVSVSQLEGLFKAVL